MTGKTDKQFLFEVQLDWLSGKKGMLTAPEAEGSIFVATPPVFGGEGKNWSPSHLFLGSISSCFMSTYLLFARKNGFSIQHFDCQTIGQAEITDEKIKFTHVHLYPKIFIADESLRDKATDALEKTNRSCLVINSVNAEIFFHSEILVVPITTNAKPENDYDELNLLL